MKLKIRFTKDGVNYVLPNGAYNDGKFVKLPDGRYFKITGWLESMPPIPTLEPIKFVVEPVEYVYEAEEE